MAGTPIDRHPRGPRSDGRANRRRVLQTLLDCGPITRARICAETGLSRATVSSLMTQFLRDETVVERPVGVAPTRSGGRPPMLVRLSPRAGTVVGVGADHDRVRVSVASLGHDILHQEVFDGAGPDAPQSERVARIVRGIRSAVAATGFRVDNVLGVAIALPAPLERRRGVLVPGPTSYGAFVDQLAPPEVFSERLGVPVVQENDANLGALAERGWGAGTGTDSFLYLLAGYGVGAGLVLDGDLYKGAWGTAGEIGHTPAVADGEVCECGNRGCLDTVAGIGRMLERLSDQGIPVNGVDDMLRLAAAGDPACRAAIDLAADATGRALGGVVNLLNPERVVVGGSLAADEPYLRRLRAAMEAHAIRPALSRLTIVPGALGSSATALGGVQFLIHQPGRSGVAARLRDLSE